MFNKLLAESYSKVRSKADEVRQTVSLQAAKAREALGLPSLHRPDASQLEQQLEHQASQASTLNQLHDIYVKWIAEILTSSESDAPLYFDYSQSFTFDFPSFMLGTTTCEKSQVPSSQSLSENPPSGDLSSQSSWISPYQKSRTPSTAPNSQANQCSSPTQGPNKALLDSAQNCSSDGMTFRQVFLRSQALEIALLTLSRLPGIRSHLVGPLDEHGVEASTRGALQRLLSLTMKGDAKVQTELLFLFCSVDLKSEAWEVHLRHLAELTALLKLDWQEDHYRDRITRLTTEIDTLNCVIHQTTVGKAGEDLSPSSARFDKKFHVTDQTSGKTERVDTLVNVTSTQLEKRSQAFKRMVELRLQVDVLIAQSIERNKVTTSSINDRLNTLTSSADQLDERFFTLTNKASDRGELVAHESEITQGDMEKRLKEAMEQKTEVDEHVEQLQKKRRDLLTQLEILETKLVEFLTQQRKAHELVDSLAQNRDLIRKSFEQKVAAANELKRQSELHQLDMKNMKILIEQSRTVIESRDSQQNKDLYFERNSVANQIKLSVIDHLENEIQILRHDSHRISALSKILNDLWDSKNAKEKQLKDQREQYLQYQNEYQQLMQINRQQNPEESPLPPSPELIQKREQLELLRAGVESASGGLEVLKTSITQAQWGCLRTTNHLDKTWQSLSDFVDRVSLQLKEHPEMLPASLISPIDPDKDEFIDVGEFEDAREIDSPESSLAEKDGTLLESDMKSLRSTAQQIYVASKKMATSNAQLLPDLNETASIS